MSVSAAFPISGDAAERAKASLRANAPKPIEAGSIDQVVAEREVERFRRALGPFVVATEATRMAMVFTNALESGNPIIFANDSFLDLMGYSFDEAVGQSFEFLVSRVADPEARARIAAQFETPQSKRSKCYVAGATIASSCSQFASTRCTINTAKSFSIAFPLSI